ncbi:hypothetical protein Acid345_1143 [Candidatus Koribacter versatilis Ellin345]|uniref:Uncharacterized protein n=1 Tax=Koribacter versatilis (strain Ellin345) TaxID=204669 RepID=Q1ISK4_KORVE|nr:beta-galactosidase [Candidatus Koribacter versatilis]ABF40146.1 hypothetical protein Acid345_1143 [Candidatus Koribacter versatilis Ellin345]
MMKFAFLLLVCSFFLVATNEAGASAMTTVVLEEPGFPTADAAAPDMARLHALISDAKFVVADQLVASLADRATTLLVLPYGSAFPEAVWPAIDSYLYRGGNLLVIGGRPFTRAAFRGKSGWELREYSVRFVLGLNIDQYQETPGSDGMQFEANPDVMVKASQFRWKRGFSPVIRLSSSDVYKRQGSAGELDARLDALAWGLRDGRKFAAPAIGIDHVRGKWGGGRWVFVNSEITSSVYAGDLIRDLVEYTERGAQEFTARPTLPLYAEGEPVQVELNWSANSSSASLRAEVSIAPEDKPEQKVARTATLANGGAVVEFPPVQEKGLYRIESRLFDGDRTVAAYHSGFWMRDLEYLRSGPKLGVNKDYFELDGRPLAVVGTTYMASDVQRLFFDHPNVYVWDKELGQISGAGLNMIRSGWWTGWDKLCDETGRPYERTLRTLEAYLMTARKHGLPVQWNFLAFLPEVLGGENPYLDPVAVRRQKAFYSGVAARFHDVPFVAWDLINEPSISQFVWKTRPNQDWIELQQWNEWLKQKYPDRAALADAWNMPQLGDTAPVPTESEFAPRAMYAGPNSLKIYDFYVFAQEKFAGWAQQMREAIRATGAQQPIVVGQDEGGYNDRPNPAFFGNAVDFTANHSWWENDSLLWDSLVAKQPGKAMLIQETGLQRELNMDQTARRTVESEGALFERKMALSFAQGSGAIQWLWNTNTYMTEGNEAPIGALRGDATEKPEATVLRNFGTFVAKAREVLRNPVQPDVAIVTSQAMQFSVIGDAQLEAQRKAVRALAYANHVAPYVIAENQIAKLGNPKLVVLPSPQALNEKTWQTLVAYVKNGGSLLVTGGVGRDEHWHVVDRFNALGIKGATEPLTYKTASVKLGANEVRMSFDQTKQAWLETARFADEKKISEASLGRGKIYWVAYPVELAEGLDAAAQVYKYALAQAGVQPLYGVEGVVSPGVLIYATVLEDAVAYLFVSDDAADTNIAVRDRTTGARLQVTLPSQRAAIRIIRKKDKSVVAEYSNGGVLEDE